MSFVYFQSCQSYHVDLHCIGRGAQTALDKIKIKLLRYVLFIFLPTIDSLGFSIRLVLVLYLLNPSSPAMVVLDCSGKVQMIH